MADGDSTPPRRGSVSPPFGERRIKVTRTHYEYRPKDSTGGSVSRQVPWIQLRGQWLVRAGFEINAPLKVRVMRGCLVLTAEEGD